MEKVKIGHVEVRIYGSEHSTGRKRWQVADYTRGKRRLRQFFSHGEALAEADRIARVLAAGQAEAAGMTNGDAGAYGRAMELLRPFGLSVDSAASLVADAARLLDGKPELLLPAVRYFSERRPDRVVARTVEQVVTEFLAHREAKGAGYWYLGDMRRRLKAFARDHQCPIGSITGPLVQGWLDGLKVAPRSLLNFRRALVTLFGFAEKRGYLTKGANPARETEGVSGKTSEKVTIFSAADCAAILSHASPEALPVLALCAFAGIRVNEALRLRWENIDLAGGWIEVGADKSKVKTRRLVPVLPALAAWLAPLPKKEGAVWKGSPLTFGRHQSDAAKAGGVTWQQNAFRHSWISARLALTTDAAKVALEAGNSPAMIFAHYRELMRPEQAEAWFAVRPPTQPKNVISIAAA